VSTSPSAAGCPRWQPSAPEDALLASLIRIGRRLRAADRDADGATLPVLHQVAALAPVRLTDLADALHLDASTVSRHVRQLVDDGLLARLGDPDDRRASRLQLTDEGLAALTRSMNRKAELVAKATSTWTDRDRATLARLVDRLADDLPAH